VKGGGGRAAGWGLYQLQVRGSQSPGSEPSPTRRVHFSTPAIATQTSINPLWCGRNSPVPAVPLSFARVLRACA
jgi:hypothetical protein